MFFQCILPVRDMSTMLVYSKAILLSSCNCYCKTFLPFFQIAYINWNVNEAEQVLALGRQAHSCLSQSCSNASVIDVASIGEIVAAPQVNCKMSESLNSAFSKQKVEMIPSSVCPNYYDVTFCRKTGNNLSFNRKSSRTITVKKMIYFPVTLC